jgi:hypothetical protein
MYMHYLFKANEGATLKQSEATSDGDACNEIKLIVPKRWVAKVDPRWGQSSFDLHCGLEVSEDQVDTVPAELLDELFKR